MVNPITLVIRKLREKKGNLAVRLSIAREAEPVVRRLKAIKSGQPGRPFCGILLSEHIGDVVACEPVIPWLRKEKPSAFIVWLTRHPYVELLNHHPQLDLVVPVDSTAACRNIVRSGVFDFVADLHVQWKFCDVHRRHYKKEWGDPGVHAGNYFDNRSLLEAMSRGAGLPSLGGQPRLTLPPEALRSVDRLGLPADYVVFHCRSSSVSRDWEDEKWDQLAETITRRFNLPVVEIGLNPVLKKAGPKIINLCGKLTVVEMAEVVHRSRHFIGIDSGPAHVANAFEIPSVILLGHFLSYKRCMPYTGFLKDHAQDMLIHWDGPASGIPVAEVLRRFAALCE